MLKFLVLLFVVAASYSTQALAQFQNLGTTDASVIQPNMMNLGGTPSSVNTAELASIAAQMQIVQGMQANLANANASQAYPGQLNSAPQCIPGMPPVPGMPDPCAVGGQSGLNQLLLQRGTAVP